ncbi:MAG: glycerol-3-phosphate acyltransferase [Devosia sp. 67-54]|uniref:glycerol-3-phosphate 1-O-acyltransferase PlsY n=1 Tax=unclassified Devosia TaxID=196773 RepID=UPI0009593D18|nr:MULTISPECIES: glycerol-3-phosphate 1-O-acyltransferase PlsY [unclassified Devosia]MBN9304250.1 glycerol-3-phosphate 1-O-acyltransferase PlsY [Devosia sp.]OJX18065.1 MAG: glycerol-3-phosphate acyltransferase [Devosia sp. 67-54]
MTGYILAAIVGYLLGSIPFGLLITRGAGLGDVRKIGSGNIGATNVLRTGRRELAAATLVLDALKGAAAVLVARYFWPGDAELVAALAAFLGHCYPVWLGFKGGKGVATMIGVLLGLAWPVGLIFCAVWLVIALARRLSSLSALTAAVTAPIFAYVAWLMEWTALDGVRFAATAAVIAVLLIWNHRSNIGRLMAGTEPKIGAGKQAAGPG